jgi:hypothetical protein
VSGTAVTVLLQPGDNWMLNVAAEQIRPGDVVVAAITADCTDGYFGDLLATSFMARGRNARIRRHSARGGLSSIDGDRDRREAGLGSQAGCPNRDRINRSVPVIRIMHMSAPHWRINERACMPLTVFDPNPMPALTCKLHAVSPPAVVQAGA